MMIIFYWQMHMLGVGKIFLLFIQQNQQNYQKFQILNLLTQHQSAVLIHLLEMYHENLKVLIMQQN